MKTFTAFVIPDLSGTVVVHDRYQNCDAVPGLIHQLCAQHIMRDLAGARRDLPGRALARPDHPGPARADPRREHRSRPGPPRHPGRHRLAPDPRVQTCVLLGLSQVPKVADRRQPAAICCNACAAGRTTRPRFTTDLRIPPTSNQAERDLRPAKTQQKISGRLRSAQATRDGFAIRGYISTVAKHGAHVLTAIHDALAGIPWMPPIPDPP